MAKIKAKLESSLDEIEEALEKEKKARIDQERIRRKAEADIKSIQSAIDAVDRQKKVKVVHAVLKYALLTDC